MHSCVDGHARLLGPRPQKKSSSGACPFPHGLSLHLHVGQLFSSSTLPYGQYIAHTGPHAGSDIDFDTVKEITKHRRKIVRECIFYTLLLCSIYRKLCAIVFILCIAMKHCLCQYFCVFFDKQITCIKGFALRIVT
jgi:hypothetical protein